LIRPLDVLDVQTVSAPTLEAAALQLDAMRRELNVENLSYWHVGQPGQKIADATWISTYPAEYRNLYRKLKLQEDDPAFRLSFDRLLPTDWDAIHSHEKSRLILEAAHDHHISPRGISFPIRDPVTGDSLFNLNVRLDDAKWRAERHRLAREFFVVAHVFHRMVRDVLRPPAAEEGRSGLSRRELAAIRCAARGLTAKQTARELGIAENSVRVFIQSAKRRLRARTKAEAVAIALGSGMVGPD
jgi:DNA-binding CsgD family transcriptional regulator